MLSSTFLVSIAATGFTVAFLHAALPTHWLPFVAAGRAQGWSRGKTLVVTGGAGVGHTLFTTLLGVLVVWAGIETSKFTGRIFPLIAGGILILFGLYYLWQQVRGGGHGHRHFLGHGHDHRPHDHDHDHHHHHDDHDHGADDHRHRDHADEHSADHHGNGASAARTASRGRSDWAVVLGLLAVLTFSPCEGFLPVYLSGIRYGWGGFALLSAILALATVAGMIAFTWLTLAGLERFKLSAVERFENGVLGAVLFILGIAVILFE
jgi:ABC-type nickel/cobalt efflux system permease component RcnA